MADCELLEKMHFFRGQDGEYAQDRGDFEKQIL
jgi:hypothetical protein